MLSPLWNNHVPMGGSPASATVYMRIMEQLGFFTALGVVIVFIAAAALGRVASVTSGIRAVEPVPETMSRPRPFRSAPCPPAPRPVSTGPASTAPASSLPLRTRADAVPAKHARNETSRPAEDTTQTIG